MNSSAPKDRLDDDLSSLRERLAQAAERWCKADPREQEELLLSSVAPRQEMRKWLKQSAAMGGEAEIWAYVQAFKAARRRRFGKWGLTVLFTSILLVLLYGGFLGMKSSQGVQRVEEQLALVKIPAGCFMMGSPAGEANHRGDEKQHEVCLDEFEMGKYEVSQWEWEEVMQENPSQFKGDKNPVEMVTWYEVQSFVRRMNLFGHGFYRLPTEAEWEYAARAGTATARYWGDGETCQYANVLDQSAQGQLSALPLPPSASGFACRDGSVFTAPVGSFKPNGFGLYDMLGNVAEWSCSIFVRGYDGAEKKCANLDDGDQERVYRGGSLMFGPDRLRAALRTTLTPDKRRPDLGFRLVRITPQQAMAAAEAEEKAAAAKR